MAEWPYGLVNQNKPDLSIFHMFHFKWFFTVIERGFYVFQSEILAHDRIILAQWSHLLHKTKKYRTAGGLDKKGNKISISCIKLFKSKFCFRDEKRKEVILLWIILQQRHKIKCLLVTDAKKRELMTNRWHYWL